MPGSTISTQDNINAVPKTESGNTNLNDLNSNAINFNTQKDKHGISAKIEADDIVSNSLVKQHHKNSLAYQISFKNRIWIGVHISPNMEFQKRFGPFNSFPKCCKVHLFSYFNAFCSLVQILYNSKNIS